MIDNIEIGKRIKQRREELGISALEIAEQTQLTRATIHRYESGEIKKIKLPVIEAIAQILDVNPDWLVGKSEYKTILSNDPYLNIFESDVKKIMNAVIDYISEHDDLVYDNKSINPEARISLIANLEAVKKLSKSNL